MRRKQNPPVATDRVSRGDRSLPTTTWRRGLWDGPPPDGTLARRGRTAAEEVSTSSGSEVRGAKKKDTDDGCSDHPNPPASPSPMGLLKEKLRLFDVYLLSVVVDIKRRDTLL